MTHRLPLRVTTGFWFLGLGFRQSSFHHARFALTDQVAIAATASAFSRHAIVPCRVSPIAAVASQGKSVGMGSSQLSQQHKLHSYIAPTRRTLPKLGIELSDPAVAAAVIAENTASTIAFPCALVS